MFILIYKFLFFLIDLLKIQRESFYQFLTVGIIEEMTSKKSIFWANQYIQIVLYGQYYQLLKPTVTIEDCLLQGTTYKSKLYLPVHFS